MGLDMYAFKTTFQPIAQVDFETPEDYPSSKIWSWRKHSDLHGWMNELYTQKGGSKEFNCVNVQLIAEDLCDLKYAIQSKKLPTTSGFFFGKSSIEDDEINEDLAFIIEAEKAIEGGECVYYSSWW